MKKSSSSVDRRKFLTGVAVAGAAAASGGAIKARAQETRAPAAQRPSAARAQAEVSTASVPSPNDSNPNLTHGKPGSDFMLDVIKSLNIDYVFTNPASSCRGLHDSIITYGDNKKPELMTCMHEESATAMAHGYFKVAGKPAIAMCHGTVGLQHATMGIYNAWCDRAPVIMMVGNSSDSVTRRPGVPTTHSVQDPAAIVRDILKWDDNPGSLQHFAESLVRAYRIAMTPPHEPVLMVLDTDLQEQAIKDPASLRIPKYSIPAPPMGESNAVREVARLLVNAENPVIVADRCARSQAGVKSLVELAEALNCTVIDQGGRMNFPNLHPLYARGSAQVARADVILGLELTDFFGTVNEFIDNTEAEQSSRIKEGTKLISIGSGDLFIHSNYQDFQRYQGVDISLAADAEATLPSLVEAVKREINPARKTVIEKRGQAARAAYDQAKDRMRSDAAAAAWDASPVSSARLVAELWPLIKNDDWALVGRSLGGWPSRMWSFDKHYQHIGGSGGAGVGYNLPSAVGGALAHKEHGRLVVNIQPDGDCMYAPGAIWTAAHHKIPMLTVMNNNRAYHQEVMHLQRMATWRQRKMDRWHIATTIRDPYMNFAKLADAMGVAGIGPIETPADLGPALKRGIDIVKKGEPVVIDVVMQPR